jgi:hypothetical protein
MAKTKQKAGDPVPSAANLNRFPRLPEETDDTGRFLRALDSLPDGGTLVVPDGLYFAENITVRKPVNILFQGKAVIESVHADPLHILRFEGRVSDVSYRLDAPAYRHDRRLVLSTAPADISPGDMIGLTDDTVRESDGMKDVNTEVHEVSGLWNPNPELLAGPELRSDSDGDGVADHWIAGDHPCAKYAVDHAEQAQRITLLPNGSGSAFVEQDVPVTPGRHYLVGADFRGEGPLRGELAVVWLDRSRREIGRAAAAEWAGDGWKRLERRNVPAPDRAAFARVRLGCRSCQSGTGGFAWFRSASFRDASTVLLLDDFVRLPKTPATSGRNVYKIFPLEHVVVRNFRYRLKEGSRRRGFGLVAEGVRHFRVDGFFGTRGVESGIQFRKAMHVSVERFRVEDPQDIGSGHGYGIQCYGGVSGVSIRDGTGVRMRHTVDLEGAFDALVENVTTHEDWFPSFLLCHNGWTSDVTVRNCKALNCRSSGFVMESQGVKDPYKLTHFNIRILDCEWQRLADPADPVCYGFGVWFKSPVKGAVIRNFRAWCGNGRDCPEGRDNGAVRFLPVQSDVLVDGLTAAGLRRGIMMWSARPAAETDPPGRIVIRNVRIDRCRSAFLSAGGEGKNLIIQGLSADRLEEYVFEGSGGTWRDLAIQDVIVTRSGSVRFFQSLPQAGQGRTLTGILRGIRSDLSSAFCRLESGWQLSPDDLLLRAPGESVLFAEELPDSGPCALPDGIVEGQEVRLINATKCTFTVCSPNLLGKGGTSAVTLSPENPSVSLQWRGGRWHQIG